MRITILIVSVAILSLLLSSCGKGSIEDKIIGDWRQISVGQISKSKDVKWTFQANHQLFRTTYTKNTIEKIDTAEWSVDYNIISENTLFIDNLSVNEDGTHLIHDLDEYMSIQRVEFVSGHGDGAYMWNEFEKY